MIIFGSLSLLGGLLALMLPETKDKKLPETINDVESSNSGNPEHNEGMTTVADPVEMAVRSPESEEYKQLLEKTH